MSECIFCIEILHHSLTNLSIFEPYCHNNIILSTSEILLGVGSKGGELTENSLGNWAIYWVHE